MELIIDHASPLPAYVQLKQQIKLAFAVGQLRPGDVLPSVRALATRLGVGEAAVRRGYSDLVERGILCAKRRQYVAVNHRPPTPPGMERLIGEAESRCQSLLDWSQQNGLSPLSVARIVIRRAAARESRSPSYVYVEMSKTLARTFAKRISKAWEINVRGLSMQEIVKLSNDELGGLTAILVNFYRYEALLELLGDRKTRGVFPLKVKPSGKTIRRIRRLPSGARVLLVHSDKDFTRIGKMARESFKEFMGKDFCLDSIPISQFSDVTSLCAKYGLIIISTHVWDQLPEKVKRQPTVVRSESELDGQFLEGIRIPAGVLV